MSTYEIRVGGGTFYGLTLDAFAIVIDGQRIGGTATNTFEDAVDWYRVAMGFNEDQLARIVDHYHGKGPILHAKHVWDWTKEKPLSYVTVEPSTPEPLKEAPMPAQLDIKLRENWRKGHVECIVNGTTVYSNSEYRSTAEWTQRNYKLSDSEMMALYYDYKEDYDS